MSAREEDLELVRRLLEVEDGLTEWEEEFAESVGRQVEDEGRHLSQKQRDVIERILTKLGR